MSAAILIAAAFVVVNVYPAYAAGEQLVNVSIVLNGSAVSFPDQQPFIDSVSGRTMIPLRFVAEKMGAEVSWDPVKNSAVIEKNGTTIIMEVDSTTPFINGVKVNLDAPAKLVNDRVMVPVRFISEAMGARVEWDGNSNSVKVYTNGVVIPPEQKTPDGMLPNEDRIQKELTQEDIQRLRSYPNENEKVVQDLNKYPISIQVTFGTNYDLFIQSRKLPILNAVSILNDIWSFVYVNFAEQAYAENYVKKYHSIGEKNAYNESLIRKYISDSVTNSLQIKTHLLSSENLIYQGSPNYTVVRTKYIFYQSNGTKI
jgi:hypothetical protein